MRAKRNWIAVGLTLLLMAVGTVGVTNDYQAQLEQLQAELVQQAGTVGDQLYRVMNEGMMNNDHARVRQIVANTAGQNDVVQVRILGLNGKVYADSGGQLQGVSIAKEMPGCVECHRNAQVPETTRLKFLPDRIRVATPIANETTCASCHNIPGAVSLGVILVDVSLAARETQAWEQFCLQLVGVTAVGLAAGWVVAGFPGLKWPLSWSWPHGQPVLPRLSWAVLAGVVGFALITLTGGFVLTRVEENDQFCAACHTEPETTYYQRSLARPVDLASAHAVENVACVQCHSGIGVTGRVDTLVLGAKNVVLFYSNQYQTPGTAETPIHTDHCVKCHAEVTQQFNANTHYHYFVRQWGEETACVACHQGHVLGGEIETGFISNEPMQPVCQACHQTAVQ